MGRPSTLLALAASPPQADGYLIDLDGTLVSGGALLPGARDLLTRLPAPFVILSNDSEHVPQQLSAQFRKWGLHVPPRNIILAGVVAIETIARRTPGARVLVIASPALRVLALRHGLDLESDRPEFVLLARDRRFSFEKLAAAAKALQRGATLMLACPDTSHPGPDGEPVPEVGALAAALLACAGSVPYEVIGKPEPTLFAIGSGRLGIPAERCIMLGDNPLTDGEGAVRAGIGFCQIAGIRHDFEVVS